MIVDDRHAMYVGWVLGFGMRHGLPLEVVVDEDRNYTDRLRLACPNDGPSILLVVPYPPDDWTLAP